MASRAPGRRTVACILLCVAGCANEVSSPEPRADGPPSILLISLDTTRADRLGAYGHDAASTPNLDALARRGALFERGYTPVPITLPAHASMFTGLWPGHHGVHDNGLHRLPGDVPTLAGLLSGQGWWTGAVVAAAVLDRQYGLDRGFVHYDDRVGALGGLSIPERNATQVTDAALALTAELTGRFLLFVHYFDPHAAYEPPAPFAERFRESPYDGEIAYVDHELGRLLDSMEARGQLRNTVVLVVADHGESLGEHGEPSHGVFLYDSTVRIPMILVAPGTVPAGARVRAPAALTDVLPTLLDLGGLTAPGGLDGRSLLPSIEASSEAEERWIVLESRFGLNSYGWAPIAGLTDGSLKWIDAPTPELYDLDADPGEASNLAPHEPQTLVRMARLFDEHLPAPRVAPPPRTSDDPEMAERLARLESLGYVAAPGRSADERDRPDPKDVIGTLAEINAARAEMTAGRPREAADRLDAVLRRSPENVSALILLGSCRIMSGEFGSAVSPLQRAVVLAPHKADVHYNLGIALMNSGDFEGAERAWRRALEVSPRYLEAAVNLIDLLQTGGRESEARETLDEARASGLDGPLIDYLDGRLALASGDRERGKALLIRAISGRLPPALAADARARLNAIRR